MCIRDSFIVPKLTPVLSAISRYLNPDRYISKGMKCDAGTPVSYTHLPVGFGFDLCPVNVFHIQADEIFGRKKKYCLRKDLVDFLLHPVAETVDGNEVRFLISGQPDIMEVTVKMCIRDRYTINQLSTPQ